LGTFEQNIEKNGPEKKKLLERKIGGKKAKPYSWIIYHAHSIPPLQK